jgi:hypothetical protein
MRPSSAFGEQQVSPETRVIPAVKRYAIYARSHGASLETPSFLVRQVEHARALLRRYGVTEEPVVYHDVGFAPNVLIAPALARLLRDGAGGHISTVIMVDLMDASASDDILRDVLYTLDSYGIEVVGLARETRLDTAARLANIRRGVRSTEAQASTPPSTAAGSRLTARGDPSSVRQSHELLLLMRLAFSAFYEADFRDGE